MGLLPVPLAACVRVQVLDVMVRLLDFLLEKVDLVSRSYPVKASEVGSTQACACACACACCLRLCTCMCMCTCVSAPVLHGAFMCACVCARRMAVGGSCWRCLLYPALAACFGSVVGAVLAWLVVGFDSSSWYFRVCTTHSSPRACTSSCLKWNWRPLPSHSRFVARRCPSLPRRCPLSPCACARECLCCVYGLRSLGETRVQCQMCALE